jgi:hypothetical protein
MFGMFFFAFVVGFFFGAICHKNHWLIVEIVSAPFALVPIVGVGMSLIARDFQAGYYAVLVVFVTLGIGLIIGGFAFGSLVGFVTAKIAMRNKAEHP